MASNNIVSDLVNGGCDESGATPVSQFASSLLQNQNAVESQKPLTSGQAEASNALSELGDVAPLVGSDPKLLQDMMSQLSHLNMSPQELGEFKQTYSALQKASDLDAIHGIDGQTAEHDDFSFLPEKVDWAHSFWSQQAGSNPLSHSKTYVFQENNEFLQIKDGLVDAGVKLFEQGRLDESILAFEAQLQQNTPNSSDVWRWLGTAHAENDEDQLAIQCLEKAIAADDENLEALLDLGVSYTNELFHDEALKYLELWLAKHPSYAAIPAKYAVGTPSSTTKPAYSGSFHSQHQRIVAMFEDAAKIDSNDPDVYTVLGVLFNLSRDYQHAEEAFSKAVQLDPKNYSLWNKLGATQANSTKKEGSKQAVSAYRKAIERKPTYTRAWVNMGISYSNQALYDLSAKYYLKALSLNDKADHVWSYLRIALQCMNREDLANLVSSRDVNQFRKEFTF
mmetsp:Transcript_19296/g.28739  ORF Transcript_19296/g.28739 Transcript_19296/m.28739 type:complete len:451 (-) Transcript_19296:23-1375(-)